MQEGLSVPAIEVNERELAALDQSAASIAELAQRVASSIVDVDTCKEAQQWAAERITFARNLRKTGWLAGIRDTWHKQHDSVCKLINKYAEPHELAVKQIVDPAIRIFMNAEDARRREEDRIKFEAQKKKDEDDRLARAEELAKQGKTAQADHVLSKPPAFVAPRTEPVKMPGMSIRKTWKVEPLTPEGMIELVNAIAGGAVPIQAIEINYSFLNKQAQSLDGNLKYPGVTCYQEETSSHRRSA